MNTTAIRKIIKKANASIKAIEDNFGYEPFTRRQYEEMLDDISCDDCCKYVMKSKHATNYTIESLIKHSIIKIVKVETFSGVSSEDNHVMSQSNEEVMSKDLWDMLPCDLRNQIMKIAEDNNDPIGFECKRFYYAWTGVTAEEVYGIIKQEAIAEMERQFKLARMEL